MRTDIRTGLPAARFFPRLTLALLAIPIVLGFAGTVLPAFGLLPALGGVALSTEPFAALLDQPGLSRSTLIAFAAGIVTPAVSVAVVALLVASWSGTRLFNTIRHAISPLLAVPHAAAAFGLAFMIAPSGWIARLFSPWATGWDRPPDLLIVNDPLGLAMMAGLVAKEIPFLLLVTLAALPQVRAPELQRIACGIGYGRIAGFIFVVWPGIYRQIRLAVLAVVAFGSSSVEVAVILGPTTPAPLPVRLVDWMSNPDLSMRFMASAGAMLQLGVTLTALAAWVVLEHVGAFVRDRLAMGGRRFPRDALLRITTLGITLASLSVVAGGLAALAIWSVAGLWQFPDALPASISLDGWTKTLPRAGRPLAISVAVGIGSTLIATLLVIGCLVRENETGRTGGGAALWLLYLPLLVPQAAFLFGLQIMFVASGIHATFAALVLVHLVFVLPYVFLSLSDPWRAFDRRHEAVAAGLGKSALRTLFAVRLPMLLPAILTAMAVGFAVSIGQYLATLLIGAGRWPTVTTEAVALAAGGNRRVIGVYAFLQLVLPFAGFALATLLPALIFARRRAMRP